jgi:hypothetical protein
VRALLFVVAFVVGVAMIAPLERWVLPFLRPPLAAFGADLQLESLRFALPAGLRAGDVRIDAADLGFHADSVYVGLPRRFQVEACGGHASGSFTAHSLELDASSLDLSRCLRVGKLELAAPLDMTLGVDGLDVFDSVGASAAVSLTSPGGVFRGVLEHAASDGSDVPLGEWEFTDLVLKARLAGGELLVDEGHTLVSGVEWELVGASLPGPGSRSGLKVDFRAREVEDTPRARALIGLMPRSARDKSGWHNYRVVGSLASPRVIGVD